MESACSVATCHDTAVKRGWCNAHYLRWHRHGDVNAPVHPSLHNKSVMERFWTAVDTSGTCHVWTRYRDPHGYGQVRFNGRLAQAHRVAWELAQGPIPTDLQVLHRCDNPPCCRVDHLFLGDPAANVQDMDAKGRRGNYWSLITHCPAGHPYDLENTYMFRGSRKCRTCRREKKRVRPPAASVER